MELIATTIVDKPYMHFTMHHSSHLKKYIKNHVLKKGSFAITLALGDDIGVNLRPMLGIST